MSLRWHGWLVGIISLALGFSGCSRRAAAPATPASDPAAVNRAPLSGEAIYQKYCTVCHMADGSGVPNFQPPLRGSPIVSGDRAKLETVIRAGSAALQDRESDYSAPMPPFGSLSDAEIQAIVDYVRQRFGNPPSPPPP